MTIRSTRGRATPAQDVQEVELSPEDWLKQNMTEEDQNFVEILKELFEEFDLEKSGYLEPRFVSTLDLKPNVGDCYFEIDSFFVYNGSSWVRLAASWEAASCDDGSEDTRL